MQTRVQRLCSWNMPASFRVQLHPDFVFCEKPRGMSTHENEPGHYGWVEALGADLGYPLYVVHRLDQGTSGAMVFARSPEAAAELTELFKERRVKKTYLALTDRKTAETSFTAKSLIERRGNAFISTRAGEANSETLFELVRPLGANFLWKASPRTGKSHQIRLHAQDHGMPLLGDVDHGGAGFYTLALHSLSLSFAWKGAELTFETEPPHWAREAPPSAARHAIEDRDRLFTFGPGDVRRLVHEEIGDWRMDQYGSVLAVYWYADRDPSPGDLEFFERLGAERGCAVSVQKMQNRGGDPNSLRSWPLRSPPTVWTASENGMLFELRGDSGLSPGLFLDQRENRRWVRAHSKGRNVLNLFSYTGGFSLAAALGEALTVCTVDVSEKFNEWARKNFGLNGFDPAAHEFWTQDVMLYLKGAVKRGRKWDLLICDPPTFGRSKNGTFRLEKDFPELAKGLAACCAPGGQILFSTNFEKWSYDDLVRLFAKAAPKLRVLRAPPPALDFERTTETQLMKAILLQG